MGLDVDLYHEYPECECCRRQYERVERYSNNITHNLTKMANEAGIYMHLWRPEEIGITHAHQLIAPLEKGYELMQKNPVRFEAFNAINNWGTYAQFLPWLAKYIKACKEYPDALVEVSR